MPDQATTNPEPLDAIDPFEPEVPLITDPSSLEPPPEPKIKNEADGTPEVTDGVELVADPMAKVPKQFLDNEGKLISHKLVKSYNHMVKQQSQRKVEGVPADVGGYEVDGAYENLPNEVMESFAAAALENKLNSDQLNWFYGILDQAYASDHEADTQKIKDHWGEKYESTLKVAAKGWDSIKDKVDLKIGDIRNNATALRLLAHFGGMMKEDSNPANSGDSTGTMDDAKAIMQKPEYWESPELQAEVQAIIKRRS